MLPCRGIELSRMSILFIDERTCSLPPGLTELNTINNIESVKCYLYTNTEVDFKLPMTST
jgi:hypothetical protein